ncbi:fibrillarin-like rRNA/tRNA 2'-O-methyltransferase [Candidatus Undinarchaeota archaeon]
MNEIFPGVYQKDDRIFTKALDDKAVYGEKFVNGYRTWNPRRSKPCAAFLNGLKEFPIKQGDKILYLGAGNGTTASHLSDIVGLDGAIYCVEFSARTMRELMEVCERRKNMIPILADANYPAKYEYVDEVDVVYQDVAQKNQGEIFLTNCKEFLKKGGRGMLMIKSRSVDVVKDPEEIYENVKDLISGELKIKEFLQLDPYERDHCCFVIEN